MRMGLPETALASFSRPFREGMFQEDRLRRLGDRRGGVWEQTTRRRGPAGARTRRCGRRQQARLAPTTLRMAEAEKFVGTALTVHAVLLIYACDEAAAEALGEAGRGRAQAARRRDRSPARAHSRRGEAAASAGSISASPTACRSRSPTTKAGAVTSHGEGRAETRSGPGGAAGRVPDRLSQRASRKRAWGRRARDAGRRHRGPGRGGGARAASRGGGLLRFRPERQLHGRARAPAGRRRLLDLDGRECRDDPESRPGAFRARHSTGWPSGWSAATGTGTSSAPAACCRSTRVAIPTTSFLFLERDPYGVGCPPGSHVRRSNPRDALAPTPGAGPKPARGRQQPPRPAQRPEIRPRIANARQDDGAERGLLFICLNTDIARQFEFVQQTWLLNPTSPRCSKRSIR
jgi:hypothetical protein